MSRQETITISLPEGFRSTVDRLMREGGYNNTSEYVRDLIRRDLERREQRALEDRLLKALDAPDTETTPEQADRLKARLRAKGAELRKKRAG